MHLFESDEFLGAFGEAHHPGRVVRFERFEVAGAQVRLPVVGGRPMVGGHFFDFAPTLAPVPNGAAGRVAFVPRVVVCEHEADGPPTLPPATWPAPFIDWRRFSDWRRFEEHYLARRSSLERDERSKRRGIARDLGPLRFVRVDERPEILDRCFAWKSAQYRAAGLPDLLRNPENVALFHGLRRRGVLVVSSLFAGERLIAAHAGVSLGRDFFAWMPAYDAEVGRYSPGRLLFSEMMRASLEAGDATFDFLIGDEPFKWHYATHWRRITSLGRPALGERVLAASRGAARSLLEHHPTLLAAARSIKNRLVERGASF